MLACLNFEAHIRLSGGYATLRLSGGFCGVSGNSSSDKPNAVADESKLPGWQPTRSELRKWQVKNYRTAALLLATLAAIAFIYLAAVTELFHHRH